MRREIARLSDEISTHAPRTGSDDSIYPSIFTDLLFQPTLPARGATGMPCHPATSRAISTHAPRTGSDAYSPPKWRVNGIFQPTLPARGATYAEIIQIFIFTFQPTLPARGATRRGRGKATMQTISTHAPRTGSDSASCDTLSRALKFQPTLPARGATPLELLGSFRTAISTHAPRTGSDGQQQRQHGKHGGFQPTLPARGATTRIPVDTHSIEFQPTLPARGATILDYVATGEDVISTHAPRTGSD